MGKANGFLAVRIAVALCAVLTVLLWAAGQYPAGGQLAVSGPADLLDELQWAQFMAPPSDRTLAYDAGSFFFAPDGSDPDSDRFVAALPTLTFRGGRAEWLVTVFEDPQTRDTVFLDEHGDEMLRLPPPPGYSPAWIADSLYPDGDAPAGAVAGYDPARVVMTVGLTPAVGAVFGGMAGAPDAGGGDAGRVTAEAGGLRPDAVSSAAAGQASAGGSTAGAAAGTFPARAAAVAGGASGAPTNAPSGGSRVRGVRSGRTVYVDIARGRDSWTGRGADVSATAGRSARGDGPKRTLGAGLAELREENLLVVRKGAYAERLDVRGTRADVRIRGNVVLGRVSDTPAGRTVSVVEGFPAQTGTVTRVSN